MSPKLYLYQDSEYLNTFPPSVAYHERNALHSCNKIQSLGVRSSSRKGCIADSRGCGSASQVPDGKQFYFSFSRSGPKSLRIPSFTALCESPFFEREVSMPRVIYPPIVLGYHRSPTPPHTIKPFHRTLLSSSCQQSCLLRPGGVSLSEESMSPNAAVGIPSLPPTASKGACCSGKSKPPPSKLAIASLGDSAGYAPFRLRTQGSVI
ncbi:uncharacterized protein EI90DRAFT_314168 [Cantharellus anzutake]|uniref:uncharacterized protein n=1 Tax=Cantharellus anzutake TaxID=1750568 RepID=UPI001908F2FE|nr:uncharacterized protein EI90DRAFT_314168 [Cantharellus anzutake]KAF8335293.1 hypothetical protein EI90DRAFT_314168 [Cantharellus anzutake]